MKIVVASDFHLKFTGQDSQDDCRQSRVLEFLHSLKGSCDLLILNGDVFDLWYAWNQVIIRGYFPLLRVLAELRESGCRIVLIAGNHDFWFNGFLEDTIGMEIKRESFMEEVNGKRLFVAHGDLYTTNDMRYQLYRGLIRSPLVMKLFHWIHPDIALHLGRSLSRTSRRVRVSPEISARKEEGLIQSAKRLLQTHDIVIFSHSHHPRRIDFERGVYINSGDWVTHQSHVAITNGSPELIIRSIDCQ